MRQLRQKNAQKITLIYIILGAINTLSDSEQRNRKYNIIKDIKNILTARKEIRNNAIKEIRKHFRLKKGKRTNQRQNNWR